MAQKFNFRNGASTSWTTANAILSIGEVGVENDTGKIKIGDGVSDWLTRPYINTTGTAQLSPFRSFGDGSDGDVTISSGITVLQRDMYYNNLTLSGSGQIVTNNFRIFIKNALDLTNATSMAINADGANGTNATASTAGTIAPVSAAGSVGAQGQGTAGAIGTITVGAGGAAPAAITGNGGASNASGQGGTGVSVGGASAGGASATPCDINTFFTNFFRGVTILGGGAGGRGGSAGGGDATNLSGAGGAGGNGAGLLAIYANKIITSSTTSSSCISAKGGMGGNGGTPTAGICGGGGGGAGGGGGFVYICYNYRFGPNVSRLIDASGGAGGAGGNGTSTAGGGGAGQGGYGGRIFIYQIPTSKGEFAYPAIGTAYVPMVLANTAAQTDGVGKFGGISGPLFLDF